MLKSYKFAFPRSKRKPISKDKKLEKLEKLKLKAKPRKTETAELTSVRGEVASEASHRPASVRLRMRVGLSASVC